MSNQEVCYVTIEIVSRETCRPLKPWQYKNGALPEIFSISCDNLDELIGGDISIEIPGDYDTYTLTLDSNKNVISREKISSFSFNVKDEPCKRNPYCPLPVYPLPTHNTSKKMRREQCYSCDKYSDRYTTELTRRQNTKKIMVSNRILNKF